jgi:tRNA A-37 threonylcarbamoyl transferase component Bud32
MSQHESRGPSPGSRIGDYDLVRELGAGAFGAVYEARQRRMGKRVALKVLHGHLVKEAEIVARFRREAEAVAQLHHPHIVDAFDVGEVDGTHYIAMEFLEGESLADRLKRERVLSLRAALDLLLPVFSAVALVHDHGVVHRDIKPANIFLEAARPGAVAPKLLDFGIAKLGAAAEGLTASAATLGTPNYMSPEQVRGSKHVDHRSDQWSLGVLLYRCLTGRLPFEAPSAYELMSAIVSAPFPAPRALDATIPAAVEDAILRAMDRDAERRHGSVRAFGAALLPFAGVVAQELFGGEFVGGPPPPPREIPATILGPRAALVAPEPGSQSLKPRELTSHGGPPRRSFALRVGAPLAVAALVAGAAAWLARPTPAAPLPAPPSAASPRPATPPPRPVTVSVRATPADAVIQLDDEAPAVGELLRRLPRDGALHSVRVSAVGHVPSVTQFRDDLSTQVTLRAVAAPPDAAPTASPRHPPRPARPRAGGSSRGVDAGAIAEVVGTNGMAIR